MTQDAFAEEMNRLENGFDVYAPENTAPLVVWLCSAASSHVTGQVFELKGGRLFLSEGWTDSPAVDKGARWRPEELGAVVDDLLERRCPPKPVYGAG
jgi:hypothetical protein